MAMNASFMLLVSLVMFGFLSCGIKGRHPFKMTDEASKNEKWLGQTMTGRGLIQPVNYATCVGHSCYPCPPPVGTELPCICSDVFAGSEEPYHCVYADFANDDSMSTSDNDDSSSNNDGSSGDNYDYTGGVPSNMPEGPCYDACPTGACEDNHNCYCSSEYDPINPFCLPKIKEIDSDYSPSQDEHEDISTSDGYIGDDESMGDNSSEDSSIDSGDVSMGEE